MNRRILILVLPLAFICLTSSAQFPPPAGQPGSTAIHADSSAIVGWATGCEVVLGYQDISNTDLGFASTGNNTMAIGQGGTGSVVSLGDGGHAVLTFATPIVNGAGWDFAVFENGFGDTFLELAFVEVSSDGTNFFRFPATSNTQTTTQIEGFGAIDATQIDNLAGKYRAMYGTPFDLEQLSGESGLDVNAVTHVKIIDVVGCIQDEYATHDHLGNKVNDPWNTPFASSGFDLDAVGVIHNGTTHIVSTPILSSCSVFPNPLNENSNLNYFLNQSGVVKVEILDLTGKTVALIQDRNEAAGIHSVILDRLPIASGIHLIRISVGSDYYIEKILVNNE